MALGIEIQKKRDATQMSAAAVSFFLDREGHKKFLRAATNQELEAENKKLKQELASKTEECDHWYTEADSYERSWAVQCNTREELESQLDSVIRDRDRFKKTSKVNFEMFLFWLIHPVVKLCENNKILCFPHTNYCHIVPKELDQTRVHVT